MCHVHDIKSAIDMQLLIIQATKWINYWGLNQIDTKAATRSVL